MRLGNAYTVAVAANRPVSLDLKDGLDLPAAALTALGTSFSGSLYVTPSTGVQIVGPSQVFWSGEGRASGYSVDR